MTDVALYINMHFICLLLFDESEDDENGLMTDRRINREKCVCVLMQKVSVDKKFQKRYMLFLVVFFKRDFSNLIPAKWQETLPSAHCDLSILDESKCLS